MRYETGRHVTLRGLPYRLQKAGIDAEAYADQVMLGCFGLKEQRRLRDSEEEAAILDRKKTLLPYFTNEFLNLCSLIQK